MRRLLITITLLVTATYTTIIGTAWAESGSPDYAKLENWLCHPANHDDPCDRDLTTTIIAKDGSFTTEKWPDNNNPAIDCFYVYPTTSLDEIGNSDLVPGEQGENITAYLQTARFRSQCRVFGPMYRQVTVPALRSGMQGKPMGDRSITIADVTAAFNHYLAHENQGRGFVLIGHSQGAGLLVSLMAAEIDGKPIQKQLVSAIITGSAVQVPKGGVVGGSFKHIPLCEAAAQTGCVITFATYRDSIPPADGAIFGRVRGEGEAGCTNPAALAGGKAPLDHYLSTVGEISLSYKEYKPWTQPPKEIPTPFVKLPGLVMAECVRKDSYHYLQISLNADPNDPRADDIAGDLWAGDTINTVWGLHLIDMSLTMGNLVDIVGKQAKAYLAKQ